MTNRFTSVWTTSELSVKSSDLEQDILNAAIQTSTIFNSGISSTKTARDGDRGMSTALGLSNNSEAASITRILLTDEHIQVSCAKRGYKGVEKFVSHTVKALGIPLRYNQSLLYIRDNITNSQRKPRDILKEISYSSIEEAQAFAGTDIVAPIKGDTADDRGDGDIDFESLANKLGFNIVESRSTDYGSAQLYAFVVTTI